MSKIIGIDLPAKNLRIIRRAGVQLIINKLKTN